MNQNEFDSEIEVPLNILKDKILYCLPANTEIEDDAVILVSNALNHFLKILAKKIPYDSNEEKKILIKDIKTCIENEDIFSFMKKLIEK